MKTKVILLGPPGCGKGTQAEILCDRLGFHKLSTGDMLREAVRNGTALGQEAKKFMDAGQLVPNDVIIGMMREKIIELGDVPLLLDGFPRTVEQADALSKIVDADAAVNLDVADDELVDRLTKRRSCPSCNSVYHLSYKPPKNKGKCDKCQADLYQRDDDTEETVRNRLEVYRKNTMPLIEYYGTRGKLITIKGVGPIDGIYAEIEAALKK